MKPFIYLSVLLITAGSAFGLSDYFKAKKDGTLAALYKETEETPELPVSVEQPAVAGNVTAPLAIGTKTAVTSEPATKTPTVAKKVKKTSKPKKLSIKMFTRGDEVERFTPPVIEEPVIETPVAVPVVAEEPVKKEQPEVKEVQPVKVEVAKPRRPSLTKMFSRARPPKHVKNIEVKPVTE